MNEVFQRTRLTGHSRNARLKNTIKLLKHLQICLQNSIPQSQENSMLRPISIKIPQIHGCLCTWTLTDIILAGSVCSGVPKVRFFSITQHHLLSQPRLEVFDFFRNSIKRSCTSIAVTKPWSCAGCFCRFDYLLVYMLSFLPIRIHHPSLDANKPAPPATFTPWNSSFSLSSKLTRKPPFLLSPIEESKSEQQNRLKQYCSMLSNIPLFARIYLSRSGHIVHVNFTGRYTGSVLPHRWGYSCRCGYHP